MMTVFQRCSLKPLSPLGLHPVAVSLMSPLINELRRYLHARASAVRCVYHALFQE